jgi:orotate phosphoribosyltransferase
MSIKDLLVKYNIIEYGEFTLKSGEKSSVYIDLRKVISYPILHKYICEELSKKIKTPTPLLIPHKTTRKHLICGTPYGAISYTSYISINNNIPMIFLRKEQKQHGTKKLIEGIYSVGDIVILIEDVVTSGESVCWAAKQLEDHGLKVNQIIAIVSRSKTHLYYNNNIPIEYLYHMSNHVYK